jgi:hypothetical protein
MHGSGDKEEVRSKITRLIAEFIENLPAGTDIEAVTMRQIKESVSAHFSREAWEGVLMEHKNFFKEQALRQLELTFRNRGRTTKKRRGSEKETEHEEPAQREGTERDSKNSQKAADTTTKSIGTGSGNSRKEKKAKKSDNLTGPSGFSAQQEEPACQICKQSGDDDKTLLVFL